VDQILSRKDKRFSKVLNPSLLYKWFEKKIKTEESTQLFKIKSSVNCPDSKGKIVTKTPSIPQSKVIDNRVRKRTFCDSKKAIEFNHTEGICRGMCTWFLYLYLMTKRQFSDSDPRSHMDALGRQFVKGGGVDPTLLQSLNVRKESS
jgi:hypothetical protein